MKKLIPIALCILSGCTNTSTIGLLQVDSVTGAFDPSVSLATARDEKGNITLQQIVSGPGAGQVISGAAAQIGAAAVFGIGAAASLQPDTTNVSNNSGSVSGSASKSDASSKATQSQGQLQRQMQQQEQQRRNGNPRMGGWRD